MHPFVWVIFSQDINTRLLLKKIMSDLVGGKNTHKNNNQADEMVNPI